MSNEYNLTYVRWTARIFVVILLFQLIGYAYCAMMAGGLGLGFVFGFMMYKGGAFLPLVLAGIVIAWKRQGLGGILITAGLIGFYLMNYMYDGPGYSDFTFTFWPGILFMLYGLLIKNTEKPQLK